MPKVRPPLKYEEDTDVIQELMETVMDYSGANGVMLVTVTGSEDGKSVTFNAYNAGTDEEVSRIMERASVPSVKALMRSVRKQCEGRGDDGRGKGETD